jgi:hypothetical protein
MIRGLRMTVAALHQRVNVRFGRLERRIDARFEQVDSRFGHVDAQFDAMDARMRAGFESLHDKIDSLARAIKAQSDQFDKVTELFEQRLRDLEPAPRT